MLVTIKKYSNRRLYDTSESRYITQDELANRIRAGVEPRVVDASTGADLTQATLTQLVLDRGAGQMLPPALLIQLIRMDDSALAEFLGYTMSWALQLFQQSRGGAPAMAPFAPMPAFNPYGQPYGGGAAAQQAQPAPPTTTPWGTTVPAPPRPAPQPCAPTPASGDDDSEVASLRREMEALKAAILGLGKQGG